MVAMKEIERFGQQIGDRFGAEQVILFGSYAKGIATKDSDVDLLVVMPFEGRGVDESVRIRMTLRPSFPVDLLVRTPQRVQQRIQAGDTFLRTILQDGKVLYEAGHI
jgi:predicted nucleotidyltransferase